MIWDHKSVFGFSQRNAPLVMCWSRAHQFLQWVQPRYQFKTLSRSIMGTDYLRGLSLAYVHDITPEPLQILQKWDASGYRRIALFYS